MVPPPVALPRTRLRAPPSTDKPASARADPAVDHRNRRAGAFPRHAIHAGSDRSLVSADVSVHGHEVWRDRSGTAGRTSSTSPSGTLPGDGNDHAVTRDRPRGPDGPARGARTRAGVGRCMQNRGARAARPDRTRSIVPTTDRGDADQRPPEARPKSARCMAFGVMDGSVRALRPSAKSPGRAPTGRATSGTAARSGWLGGQFAPQERVQFAPFAQTEAARLAIHRLARQPGPDHL